MLLDENSVVILLEPFHSVFLVELMRVSDFSFFDLLVHDSLSWSFENDVEVHSVDSSAWVVSKSEIDVLLDTKSEVSILRETALFELVLLDSKSSFEQIFGFVSSDGDVGGDFLSSSDGKGSDSDLGLVGNWLLSAQVS